MKLLLKEFLDPHTPSLADAPDKARGLARYADRHSQAFGRIEMIVLEDGELKRLDLADEAVRRRVLGVTTHEHLKQLFRED